MGAKYDIWFKIDTQERGMLEKTVKVLNESLKNEKFTVEEYIHGEEEKLEIEPNYLLLDEGDLGYLEMAAKALSSMGVTGYIDILFYPYQMEYIHILGDGNYVFGSYVRVPT